MALSSLIFFFFSLSPPHLSLKPIKHIFFEKSVLTKYSNTLILGSFIGQSQYIEEQKEEVTIRMRQENQTNWSLYSLYTYK